MVRAREKTLEILSKAVVSYLGSLWDMGSREGLQRPLLAEKVSTVPAKSLAGKEARGPSRAHTLCPLKKALE